MLAYEIKERCEVRRKQQWGSARQFCRDRSSMTGDPRERLVTTYKANVSTYLLDVLLGGKRTLRGFVATSANDPKRTSASLASDTSNVLVLRRYERLS